MSACRARFSLVRRARLWHVFSSFHPRRSRMHAFPRASATRTSVRPLCCSCSRPRSCSLRGWARSLCAGRGSQLDYIVRAKGGGGARLEISLPLQSAISRLFVSNALVPLQAKPFLEISDVRARRSERPDRPIAGPIFGADRSVRCALSGL